MEPLVLEWAKVVDLRKPPFYLPGDEAILTLRHTLFESFEDYSESGDFGNSHTLLHLGLIPKPYLGDLEKAKVFILMLNPGFLPLDYYAECNSKPFREALLANLQQKNLDPQYPFLFLNPSFAWHSGGSYWLKKFSGLIQTLQNKYEKSYLDTLSFLSRNIAVLEYFPYHSASWSVSEKIAKNLKSTKLMTEFVKTSLLPRASSGELLLIAARGAKAWDLESSENVLLYSPQEARSAHLSEKSSGGKAILEFLVSKKFPWEEFSG